MPAKDRRRQRRPGPVKIVARNPPDPPPAEDEAFHQALKAAFLEEKRHNRFTYMASKRKGQIR